MFLKILNKIYVTANVSQSVTFLLPPPPFSSSSIRLEKKRESTITFLYKRYLFRFIKKRKVQTNICTVKRTQKVYRSEFICFSFHHHSVYSFHSANLRLVQLTQFISVRLQSGLIFLLYRNRV